MFCLFHIRNQRAIWCKCSFTLHKTERFDTVSSVCARTAVPAKVELRYSNVTHRELKCYLEQDWLHFVLLLTHLPLPCEYFWLCSPRTQRIQRWMTPHLMRVWHHFRLLTQTLCVLSAWPPMFAVNDNDNNNNNCIATNNNNQWILSLILFIDNFSSYI
jgi:hypothetical protein